MKIYVMRNSFEYDEYRPRREDTRGSGGLGKYDDHVTNFACSAQAAASTFPADM